MTNLIEGILFFFMLVGIGMLLHFYTYAISLGWHKGKAKYPTVVNNYYKNNQR